MKGRKQPIRRIFLGALVIAFLLTGCEGDIPLISKIGEREAYSLPQSMIILTTERNRYQKIYTDQIWEIDLPGEEKLESYLFEQVKEFLEEMKRLNLLAESKGVDLESNEKEKLLEASEEYFGGLTLEDIAYMGITQEDVYTMYEQYCLSNKIVTELTKEMDLEISDSEAKVIIVNQIVLKDKEKADEVYSFATAENADFFSLAKEYSTEEILERSIGRGETSKIYEEAAFRLLEGEISPVVEDGGTYYIIKCINDYEESATRERKKELYQKRKQEAFDQIYTSYKEENPIVFRDDIWEGMSFSREDKTTTTNFFEIYKKYLEE